MFRVATHPVWDRWANKFAPTQAIWLKTCDCLGGCFADDQERGSSTERWQAAASPDARSDQAGVAAAAGLMLREGIKNRGSLGRGFFVGNDSGRYATCLGSLGE
ncbi:hypothetical protein STUTZSP0542_06780 [Stutzerimonas marianensis]